MRFRRRIRNQALDLIAHALCKRQYAQARNHVRNRELDALRAHDLLSGKSGGVYSVRLK